MSIGRALRVAVPGAGDDIAPLGRWLADPRIARGLNIAPRRLGADELRRYVGSFDGRSAILLGIFADDTLAGVATFDINQRHRSAMWTLVVGDRGLREGDRLFEIGLALFDWAFTHTDLEKVSSRVAASKLVLLYFLDGLGIRREGHLRQEVVSVDGSRRQDEILHGLLKTEWPELRARIVARLHPTVR